MYMQSVHRMEDREQVVGLMQAYPFATLVSVVDGEPVASHLPILAEPGEPFVLMAHMAHANSHWRAFRDGARSLAIFAGPHGYVTPRWYVSRPNVPTWNYVAVHAHGCVEIIEDERLVLEHLRQMVDILDPTLATEQPESMDESYLAKLSRGVVVFKMTVERLEGKAKLNQNKTEEDRLAVRSRYLESSLADEIAMASMMSD
ncbi:MAG: FMN-binding negative transcriptional regulator [Fimbriimonas sp.]|nr:FMN-binding negative transcriptional regulator [Fimbriimonas sp.]